MQPFGKVASLPSRASDLRFRLHLTNCRDVGEPVRFRLLRTLKSTLPVDTTREVVRQSIFETRTP